MRKIRILYITLVIFSFICNAETKLIKEKIKNFIASRKAFSFQQEDDIEGLKEVLKSFFKVGTSTNPYELNRGSESIKKHFNSITLENELKPDFILNQQACQSEGNNVNTQVYFGNSTRTILKFCEDNGISIRGHTFVWYSQTPNWFFKENFDSSRNYVTADIMDQRLESLIKNTFELLAKNFPKLEIYAYDVVYELFTNDGGAMRGADNSNWAKVYNDDSFVIKAFTYARKYAPKGCRLFISDYNEYIPAKTNDIYNLAMKLKEMGIIDGIAMQSHIDVRYPSISVYKTAFEKFVSSGLDIQITEFEITTDKDISSQIEVLKDIFQLFVDNADKISSFTFWDTSDTLNWRSNKPFIFGQGYQPKEGYYVILEIAKSALNKTDDNKSDNIRDEINKNNEIKEEVKYEREFDNLQKKGHFNIKESSS